MAVFLWSPSQSSCCWYIKWLLIFLFASWFWIIATSLKVLITSTSFSWKLFFITLYLMQIRIIWLLPFLFLPFNFLLLLLQLSASSVKLKVRRTVETISCSWFLWDNWVFLHLKWCWLCVCHSFYYVEVSSLQFFSF